MELKVHYINTIDLLVILYVVYDHGKLIKIYSHGAI